MEAPISAFFGCAYDENFADIHGKYPVLNSAMVLVAPGRGYNCYWEMPFRKHCRVTMENRGEKPQTLYYMISGWHGAIPEGSGYFHAAYRQEQYSKFGPENFGDASRQAVLDMAADIRRVL